MLNASRVILNAVKNPEQGLCQNRLRGPSRCSG